MSIFEGAVSGLSGVANKLGFNFLTGNIPLVPPAPIYVGLQVPELNNGIGSTGPANHTGGFFLNIPNHSAEFGDLAIQMAQEALVTIELAVALQTITDPEGGIKIKDALDPYHYNIVRNALIENKEPVPPQLSLLPPGGPGLGGITFSGGVGLPILTEVAGAFPSYSLPLNIMSAAITMKTIALQYITSLLRNSIDAVAGALILKNVLDDFSVAVSANAIQKAGGTPPEATVQTGEDGIF